MPVVPEKRGAGEVSRGELHHSKSTNGVSNCKFQEMVSGIVYVKGCSSLARQRREKIARRMRGAGGRRKGRKTTAPS